MSGTRRFLVSMFWILLFLAASYLFFTYLIPYVLPFVLAIFLAVLIDPWVGAAQRLLRAPRGVATALVLVVSFVFLALVVAGLGFVITYELSDLIGSLDRYYSLGLRLIQEGMDRYDALLQAAAERPELQKFLTERLSEIYRSLSTQAQSLPQLFSLLGILPSLIVFTLVTLVSTFFLSRDKRVIARFLLSLLPDEWRRQVTEVKMDVFESAVGFVKAEITLVSITGLMVLIFLNLIGMRYAALLAVLAGLLDVLPVIGPSLIFLPWAAFHLAFGEPLLGAKLLLAYGAVSGLRTVIEPKILGDRIGLHPLATLTGLYLGLQIFGPLGVIYGPLTLILLKAMVAAGILPLPGSSGGKSL